jgi:hypothetical protein
MINEDCGIYQKGKGFCWCPSEAWSVSDEQLCQLCHVKNAERQKKFEFVLLNNPKTVDSKKVKEPYYRVAASA